MKREMIQGCIKLWREPADILLGKAENTIASHFSALCKQHFKHYKVLRNHGMYVSYFVDK